MVYGYCRVSTKHQRITRQITNITELYPNATLIKEFYTGTTQNRPLWDKLMKQIRSGDTIVFDSVSRMSRNAEEGFKDYKTLYIMDSGNGRILAVDEATGKEIDQRIHRRKFDKTCSLGFNAKGVAFQERDISILLYHKTQFIL